MFRCVKSFIAVAFSPDKCDPVIYVVIILQKIKPALVLFVQPPCLFDLPKDIMIAAQENLSDRQGFY